MKILSLLLVLIFTFSAALPDMQREQPVFQDLVSSVRKKNLSATFPASIQDQMLRFEHSDPNDSDSSGADNCNGETYSGRDTENTGIMDIAEVINSIPSGFASSIQEYQATSLCVSSGTGADNCNREKHSDSGKDSYQDRDWADYSSESSAEESSDDGDNKSEKITLPRSTFHQNIQENQPVPLGLNDLDGDKKTDRANMSVAIYVDNTETKGPFTLVSKPCANEDQDIPIFAELVILNEEKINNSKIQREVYDNLFNIFYRVNEAMIAYPEYLLKDRDKGLLEQFMKPTNLAITSEQKQVLSNVIDGMAISLDEVKILRQMVSNYSIDSKARKAIKNVLAIREFNNSEKEILKIIKPLYSKQRKFLLSLLEVATKGVMAVPFKSGYAFDISDENIKGGLLTGNGDDIKCEGKALSQALLTYSIFRDLLTDDEIKKRNMLLSYNNYCWINNQLFGEECLNQELTKILCDVDNITDSDMLFAKFVRRVVKTFDVWETIESICGNEEFDMQYDKVYSRLRPRKRLYNKRKLADSIRNMLSEYNEEIASYSTYSVENLNQFQSYVLKVMHSDGISRHIAGQNFIVLCECKLTEGLEEDDITTTVKACINIMNVISSELVKELRKGCKEGIPDSFIYRISTEVWKDVICKFQK